MIGGVILDQPADGGIGLLVQPLNSGHFLVLFPELFSFSNLLLDQTRKLRNSWYRIRFGISWKGHDGVEWQRQ